MLAEDVRQPIIDPDSPLPGLVIKGGIWPEGYTASRSQLYGYDDDDA